MKPKIFKPLLIALLALVSFIKSYAQQAVATSIDTAPKKFAPIMPVMPMMPMPKMMAMSPGSINYYGDLQDTAYKAKMQELNAKMRELQKEMNDVRQQQIKAQNQVRMEMSTKQRTDALTMARDFDVKVKTMNGKSFNFNRDDANKDLEEKIKSGQVKQKIKSYSKSYTVDKGDKIAIDNTYGKISINTWAKNEIKVDVEIKADADDDDKAQKILDRVSITDSKQSSTIAFTTTIQRTDDNSWGTWSNNGNVYSVRKVEVNYTVYMPAKNPLQIDNKYGSVTLPDFEGQLNINNMYGNFTAKTLSGLSNSISNKYGTVTIGSLKGSTLDVAYGGLVDLGTTDNLTADIKYTPVKIGKMNGDGNISIKYGNGLSITNVDNVKNLSINSSYAPVYLNVGPKLNCDFDVSVQYNEFVSDDSKVKIVSKTPADDQRWSSTKTYKGYVGKSNSDNKITIVSRYNNVVFQ